LKDALTYCSCCCCCCCRRLDAGTNSAWHNDGERMNSQAKIRSKMRKVRDGIEFMIMLYYFIL